MNYDLIRILSNGEFHSGEALGRQLGMTRSAVWKNIAQLESLGLSVESVKGKGYRLAEALDLLHEARILSGLDVATKTSLQEIKVFNTLGSTNSYLKDRLSGLAPGMFEVCVAETQTSGRGRRGREWQSPFAKNLYFSISLKLSGGFAALSGLSLAIGVAVARAVMKTSGIKAGLKWPNDVWIDGRKLAGILIDVEGEHEGPVGAVIGVGLNVSMTEVDGRGIDQPWTSLSAEASKMPDRSELLASLINEMWAVADTFTAKGFAAFTESWHEYDALLNREVILKGFSEDHSGIYRGVDEQGLLLLEDSTGSVLTFSAGEVSLRLSS